MEKVKKEDQELITYNCSTNTVFKLPPYPPHNHPDFELSFVTKGKTTNVINGTPYLFSRNRCVIIRPIDNHYFDNIPEPNPNLYEHIDIYVDDEPFKLICNTLSPYLYEKIMSHSEPIEFFINDSAINYITQKQSTLKTLNNKSLSYAIIFSITTTILTFWLESLEIEKKSLPAWINKLIYDLNDLNMLSLPVSEIAKKTGYSPSYFSREFSKYIGMPFISYLTKKRIYYSIDLLRNKIGVMETAQILGYSNPSTFCKHFKKEFKYPPSQVKFNDRNNRKN